MAIYSCVYGDLLMCPGHGHNNSLELGMAKIYLEMQKGNE